MRFAICSPSRFDVRPAILLTLTLALHGCGADPGGPDNPAEESVGAAAQAVQTVSIHSSMSCSTQPGVEAELTSFVTKAQQNLDAQAIGGIGGYAIFASRRAAANGQMCAVATSGGLAKTPADATVWSLAGPMTINTTSGVGSISKVVTAAYLADVLAAHNIPVTAQIGPYLPPQWTRGPGVDQVTFYELLTHTSGLATGDKPGSAQMDLLVADGCLPGPTLTASVIQYFGGDNIGVAVQVKGTWGATTDWISLAVPGSPNTSWWAWSKIQAATKNADNERTDATASFLGVPAGDYVARVFFQNSYTKRAEIKVHVSSTGAVTTAPSNFRPETCPFRGGYRYSNAGYKLLPLLAARISQSNFYSQAGDLVELAGLVEESYVRTHYLQAINDGATPPISANPSCNAFKDYYAWAYPASATTATHGDHKDPNVYQSCGQGTWFFSAQDLNFLLDRMHWNKVGTLGQSEEAVVGQDIYGSNLYYGFDGQTSTAAGYPFIVKGGLLDLGIENYAAMAAHFPNDTNVAVLYNSDRKSDGTKPYAQIKQAWDDSHPQP